MSSANDQEREKFFNQMVELESQVQQSEYINRLEGLIREFIDIKIKLDATELWDLKLRASLAIGDINGSKRYI